MKLFTIWPKVRFLILITTLLMVNSCKETEYEKTATIRFEVAEATYAEDASSVKIGVYLDHVRNENLTVNTKLVAKDTATYRDIDFQLSPELLIKPFAKTSYFQLSILNDKQIDRDDYIELTLLQPTRGNVKLSDNAAEQKYNLIIRNNDIITPDKFQADLSWRGTKPEASISITNFDLYVQTSLSISNGLITDIGDTFTSSTEVNAFETVNILEKNPDQPYYIIVFFGLVFQGDTVTYTLTLNGFGFSNRNFGKSLNDVEVGSAIVYGPFYKSGNKIIGAGRQTGSVNEYHVSKEKLQTLGFRK
ncbi:MAG: hypothetical protein AABY93_03290 [Bacteroidota bacterium]